MRLIDLVSSSPVLFYEFFPEFNRIVGDQFRDICQSEIGNYHASTNTPIIDSTGYAAINCLYDSNVTDSATVINYAGTGVLLGLLPTILSIFGSNTWETALLSTRRPFLSFLLALGAPVVTPARLFESMDPREFLELGGKPHFSLPQPERSRSRLLVLIVEYVLALAAIANVTSIALDLSIKAVSIGFAPVSQRFHWLLWGYIAAIIHLIGLWAFCGRLSPAQTDRPTLCQRVRVEFQLCSSQAIKEKYQLQSGNLWSFALSALVSFLIVGHIIYGTALFSTTQLVLGADALEIIARYMASAIICRAVLVFELHGLRDKVVIVN